VQLAFSSALLSNSSFTASMKYWSMHRHGAFIGFTYDCVYTTECTEACTEVVVKYWTEQCFLIFITQTYQFCVDIEEKK